MMSGLARRPIWADARTPKIVATNAWKAKQDQSSSVQRLTLKERRTRKSADGWRLQMQGYKSQSRIKEICGRTRRAESIQTEQNHLETTTCARRLLQSLSRGRVCARKLKQRIAPKQ